MIPNIKIIHKNRLPLKYLKNICKIHSKAWNYDYPNHTRFVYWMSILAGVTDKISRSLNSVYLALDNGKCIGYLKASLFNKPRLFHPVLLLINLAARFFLFLSGDGRKVLEWRRLYHFHKDRAVDLGKVALLGKDYKQVSEALSVAVYPEYRKQGIYREMTKQLMTELTGYIIFHTSTESIYQAHEALGYKKILEVPYFYPEKHITFIMYGKSNLLKLCQPEGEYEKDIN